MDWMNFSQITIKQLRDSTFSVYQLKLAPSYVQDRLQPEDANKFYFQGLMEEPEFLRARIYFRFTLN